MDQTPIHKNPGLKEWLNERNRHKIKLLPPYSPFLNPVEECFSKLKNFVKKHPMDGEERLRNRIKEGSYQISKEDCEGLVRHAVSFHKKCIDMEKNL